MKGAGIAQPVLSLAKKWTAEVQNLDWNFLITTLHGPRRKHSLSIVGKACLE
jgi:hypothetical protein